jgi:hypothetical protein
MREMGEGIMLKAYYNRFLGNGWPWMQGASKFTSK